MIIAVVNAAIMIGNIGLDVSASKYSMNGLPK
jgi:hypothetical protein